MVIRTKGKDKSSINLLRLKSTGLLDGYVIKQYKDKIVLAAPQKKTKTNPTPEQRAQRFNLKQAVAQAERQTGWHPRSPDKTRDLPAVR